MARIASMTDRKPRWYLSKVKHPGHPMSAVTFPCLRVSGLPITLVVERSCPNPAAGVWLRADALE